MGERKPEELIALLLERACVGLRRATLILENEELGSNEWEVRLKATEQFQLAISKTLQIVTALREILDHQNGGEIAAQLNNTYTAIIASLWKSSKERNAQQLKKILDALVELKEAWETVGRQ